MRKGIFYLALIFLIFGCKSNQEKKDQEKIEEKRIVSLNGTITEILFALEAEKNIVGIDVTSTFPEKTASLTNLGHISQLNIESLIGLSPTHVLAFKDELAQDIKDKLKASKIEILELDRELTVQGTKKLINDIADWLGEVEKQKALISSIDQDLGSIKPITKKPNVLFVYARGAGTLMVGGENTPVEKIIEMAGGVNAAKGFEDYKPLTSEAVVEAKPDVILMFDSGAQSLGPNGVFNMPGVALTNAGKNKKVITMDGQYLSGFGPRLGKAAAQLNKKLSKI
jgi:iron complex transport system substrate-binding protein